MRLSGRHSRRLKELFMIFHYTVTPVSRAVCIYIVNGPNTVLKKIQIMYSTQPHLTF